MNQNLENIKARTLDITIASGEILKDVADRYFIEKK